MFYSKVIARRVNTFIPLEDEMMNSSLVERERSLMDPKPHPLLHFLVWMISTRRPRMSFFKSQKCGNHKGKDLSCAEDVWVFPSQISEAYPSPDCQYALSCIRIIPSDSIPGRFDFMARRSTLSHQETKHTSLLFFVCLHFQCWTDLLHTTLTSRTIKQRLCGPGVFTMHVSYSTDGTIDT